MTDSDILTILKLDLQLQTSSFDNYLSQLIAASREMIGREGITLNDSAEDGQIIMMYAAYLYRKRAEENPSMPRMLRWSINNRLFSEKGGETDAI